MPIPAYVDGDLRVQFLSPTLVRIERKGPKGFEDRPTFTAVGRAWTGVPFRKQGANLVTPGYTVVLNGGSFDGIRVVAGGKTLYTVGKLPGISWLPAPGATGPVWAMADSPRLIPPKGGAIPANLGGPLGATSGYDTGNDAPDLYLFVTKDPKRLRADYLKLTGPIPLVPRYTFGYWDSRWYPYTESMALASIDEYRRRGLPLDLFVVDTDWRVGASKGYGVNTKLFPDMPRFLRQAHARGVRTMFNDHPEPQAPTALEPKETLYRWNGLTDLLRQGLDVWWYDRNWSTRLREPMPGIRPEAWGASVFHDITQAYASPKRPLIMANVDGIDNGVRNRPPHPSFHRYPISWTGDTTATWTFLRRAVENGVDEGTIGMLPYVHEDAGGHNGGAPSPELYTRFMQYCALSPVLRVHCTYGLNRYPWAFGPQAEEATFEAIRFRYRLIPTLYSLAHRASEDGTPLLRRLDLEWPAYAEATTNKEYLLGDDLLVSPVITSDEPELRPYPGTPEGGTFRAEYFANKDAKGEPAVVRDDAKIDFDWGQGAPAPGLPKDDFSARWTGRIGPMPETMEYVFGTSSDDGVRMWIDGKKVVDKWEPLDSATSMGKVQLEKGKTYDLRLEYFDGGGGANVHLLWGGAQPPQKGPRSQRTWLPPGTWVDLWTGARQQGPKWVETPAPLRKMPLFLRDGAILFLGEDRVRNSDEQIKRPITLETWAGPKTVRTMVEDDGITVGAKKRYVKATAQGSRLDLKLTGGPRDLIVRMHLRPGQKATSVSWQGKPVKFRREAAGAPAAGLSEAFRARGGEVVEVALKGCVGGTLVVGSR